MIIRRTLKKIALIFATLLFAISGCDGGEMPEKNIKIDNIKSMNPASRDKLAQKKIYFGHQSVGNNILLGIQDLMNEYEQIKLNIVETKDPAAFTSGIFAHSAIGQNEKPETKIKHFEMIMDKGIGAQADIAFFKFCFVDVDAKTDVDKVFNAYKSTMKTLKGKYPETTFIHCTVPLLRKEKTTPKAFIKKMLGKDEGFFARKHNISRNRFNELMKKEYEGKYPIFDLAKIESTYSDGSRESFRENGKTYYSLVPSFTKDGGHLNEIGRKVVAEQLLRLLSKIE